MVSFEHNFKVITDESEIRRRLVEYAGQAGYKSEDSRIFRRGTGPGRFLAGYPRNMPTELTITTRRDPEDWQVGVLARITVGGAGQLMAADAEYWQAELHALEQALCGKPVNFQELKRHAQAVEMRRLLIFLVILFSGVLGGTLARVLFDNPSAFWFGGVIGASLGIGFARPLARRGLRPTLGGAQSNRPLTVSLPPDTSLLQLAMRRDIRSWGGWMIVLGIISFISSGFLDSSWGVLLIVVGLGSLVFQTPAMYIIYGVTLAWAAVNNALLGSGTWAIFSLVQVVMAIQTFGQFRRFNKAYQAGKRAAEAPVPPEGQDIIMKDVIPPDPYAPFLSWLSLGMGILGLFGLLAVLGFGILQNIFQPAAQISADVLGFASGVAIDFNLLGFSAGLGSLLARHRFKGASITGMIAGGLGIVIMIGLMIAARV
jgi:hypothetical protein